MPDKATWCGRLPEIAAELQALPFPWIDRPTVERLLHVGRRRAQQILQPCVRQQIGANGLADRDEFLSHLQRLASGEAAYYERRRREQLARTLTKLNQTCRIEAPAAIVKQE